MPNFTVTTPKGNVLDVTADNPSAIDAACEAADRDGDAEYTGTYLVRPHRSDVVHEVDLEEITSVDPGSVEPAIPPTPEERVRIRRGEFPGVDELTATAIAALPSDGTPMPFATLVQIADADADQLFGALAVLKAQGRVDIAYGFGWYRTLRELAGAA